MRSKKKNDFEVLVGRIQATSDALQQDALVVINRSVTTRAWLTGYYIVEYEQHGADRAKYGVMRKAVLVALVAAMVAKADYWMTFCKTPGIDWKYGFSPNVHFLGDRGTKIDGVKFYGTPWVPIISYSWAFEGEPDTLKSWFSKIPVGFDVLVTHSPPRIPGSDVDRSLQTDSEHFGSPELTEAILEKRPSLVFCGHIHTGQHGGVDFEGSRIYNVSRLDERYEIAYEPTWVDV